MGIFEQEINFPYLYHFQFSYIAMDFRAYARNSKRCLNNSGI